jgi:hypothetical protein
MKPILILGARLSSNCLRNYLEQQASEHYWLIRVGDRDVELARQKSTPATETFEFDVQYEQKLVKEIGSVN